MAGFNPKTPHEKVTKVSTHEGGQGYRLKAADELILTAAVTYANEDTFYETGGQRLARLIKLTRDLTARDPLAVAWAVKELRQNYKIRGAPIVIAVEYARRLQELNYLTPTAAGRPLPVAQVVDSAIGRADEPAELVAYWQQAYGTGRIPRRKAHLPAGVRKGLALAVQRLYTERAALKWDGDKLIKMADVIQLVHPKPVNDLQSALFKFILDQRRHGDGHARIEDSGLLPMIMRHRLIGQTPEGTRRLVLRMHGLRWLSDGGYTWEALSGWLPGGMDAQAWEAIIPSMGVFALIRNLRNFDDAGISETAIDQVIAKITNQTDVTESGIMPYRVWTAYQNVHSDNWKRALGKTLELASGNVPTLDTPLVVIDISLSMRDQVSNRSTISRVDLAALQALTIAKQSPNSDVIVFAEQSAQLDHLVPNWRRMSTLNAVSQVHDMMNSGVVGGGTWGNSAIARHFTPNLHKHVVMFTDGQMHDSPELIRHVPSMITFNIGGYVPVSNWGKGRINVAGYSDQVFSVVSRLLSDRM